MENASRITFSHIEKIRHRFAARALAEEDGQIRVVAASAQNWPELTSLGTGEIALGDDSLIRLALWSASKCCATLLGTRRATLLLPEDGGAWEIRCLVMANAGLATPRPLSGFLLQPVELLDGRLSRGVTDARGARRALEDRPGRAGETRGALFDAFPVSDADQDTLRREARAP